MPNTKHSKFWVVAGVSFGLLIAALAIFGYTYRQAILDHLSMWSYQPTANVQQLSDSLDLTYQGKLYFYTAHPELNQAETFNQNCPRVELNSPILGCLNGERIFIYDIDNSKLKGVEEVTAAHEMLHVAWLRLSADEQERLGELLIQEAETINDKGFKERLDYYKRNEPGQLTNELHSIIGTEKADISDELERYYDRYFNDRLAIVGLYENYSSVFNDLLSESEALSNQIKTTGESLSQRIIAYELDVQSLSNDIDSFNYRASQGSFSSMNQFYSERSQLAWRSNQLSIEKEQLDELINKYNQLVDRYNKLAIQLESLHSSIDSLDGIPLPSL